MLTKLTLSIPKSAVQKGKKAAQQQGVSLSKLVAQFLNDMSIESPERLNLDHRVRRLLGSYRIDAGTCIEEQRLLSILHKQVH